MTVVQVDLPHDTYQQLRKLAARAGRRVEDVVQEMVVDRLPPGVSERERGIAVLDL